MMKINYSFWFLIIYSLFLGYFKELLILILCLLIHELGHYLIVLIFKLKVNYFNVSLFGGDMNISIQNVSKPIKLILYFNGVIFNFLFLLCAFIFNAQILIKFNLIIIIINLIPIYPLDGFNICNLIFPQIFVINLSIICLIAIFIISIYTYSLGLLLIFLFLLTKFIQFLKINNEKKLYNIIQNMI